MEPFKTLTAVAAPIDMDNVDNDQVLPARLMRKPRIGTMYGTYLFHDLRFNEDASVKPEFVLNQPSYRDARIIVASKNYACGSSRLGAVYVHYDFGIRSIIATSFGDVFYNNCFKNGMVPVRLDEAITAQLRAQLRQAPGAQMTVDLERQIVTGPDKTEYPFEVDTFAKRCALLGLSDIGLTLERKTEIEAFEKNYYEKKSWLRQ